MFPRKNTLDKDNTFLKQLINTYLPENKEQFIRNQPPITLFPLTVLSFLVQEFGFPLFIKVY